MFMDRSTWICENTIKSNISADDGHMALTKKLFFIHSLETRETLYKGITMQDSKFFHLKLRSAYKYARKNILLSVFWCRSNRFWYNNSNTYRGWISKCFRSPGIDSKEWIPPAYVPWRAGTITLMSYRSIRLYIGWQNRFLGFLNVYKFRLSNRDTIW
jgi:hypothetical protein